ncbi:MAG: hypothetical protein RLZZ126_740 [Pseudomonadota bacterium]
MAVMAFSVVDTMVTGRYSTEALAALSIGTALYISVFVALWGVLQVQLPHWSELHGSGQHAEIGRMFRQGVYLVAALSAVGMVVLFNPGWAFQFTDVPADLHAEIGNYLSVLAWSLPSTLLFRMFGTLNQSLSRPRIITALQLGSLALKVPLSIWFAFGGLGLQAQGVVGCAWASLIVHSLLLLLALVLLQRGLLYRQCKVWQAMEPPDVKALLHTLRLGVPNAMAVLVEVTSFTLMALFIARMGTVATAAHQIAVNLTATLYMVPLSISIAASSRLSFWLGARDAREAHDALRSGLLLVAGTAMALSLSIWLLAPVIVHAYTSSAQVAVMAAPLLAWVAVYHLADGTQTLCFFLLRCFRVTTLPFVIYAVLLWGGGLGLGHLLAYRGLPGFGAMHAPQAFWLTSAAALVATAAAFLGLLNRVAKKNLDAPGPVRPR